MGDGWPVGNGAGFVAAWQAACEADPLLRRRTGPALRFAACSGDEAAEFRLPGAPGPDDLAFTLRATPAAWEQFLRPTPPRHHHNLLAMRMRVPEFAVEGDELRFAQHLGAVRRAMELGRFLRNGGTGPAPALIGRPSVEPRAPVAITGRYLPVRAGSQDYRIFAEQAGPAAPARDVLCLHTAGADGRQFHRLMAEPGLAAYRFTSFDLPWHGKSPPPDGAGPADWRLDTDLYVEIIMGVLRASELRRPVLLGASMSGEICLEVALRHPDSFAAIVACEASDKIEGRKVPWADHPAVNGSEFVPEWVYGLMAPQSPAECAVDVWWHYSQGGAAVFARDIDFYSGSWDARDRVGRIDTRRCPLHMLTGEYDFSCTAERSAETAAKIPGAQFRRMDGIGHFPFAENPALFAGHLLPILRDLPRD